MAAPIAEPPHLAADLKTLCLSTITAQWRPLAEQATRQRQVSHGQEVPVFSLPFPTDADRRTRDGRISSGRRVDPATGVENARGQSRNGVTSGKRVSHPALDGAERRPQEPHASSSMSIYIRCSFGGSVFSVARGAIPDVA